MQVYLLAPRRPIATDRNDAAVTVTHKLSWASIPSWTRASDGVHQPTGAAEEARCYGPFVSQA